MSTDVPDALTVSEVVAAYERQGYVMSFNVQAGGLVRCGSCGTTSKAEDVHVDAIARAEGPSDTADMALVAIVTCPWCRVAGTLVAGYGPSASLEDADVVVALSDERERDHNQPAVLFPDPRER
jgi:hypothetical protein